jgi:hypothetical protein
MTRAETAFEKALEVATKWTKWMISEQDAPVIERLLALQGFCLSAIGGSRPRVCGNPTKLQCDA